MNAITLNALNAYKKVDIETTLDTATPEKLILMLFEGAQISINNAKRHMLNKEIPQKGASISKAIMIIDNGLKASLDIEKGGEISQKLYSLYEYMTHRLLIANNKNKPEILDEVLQLLSELSHPRVVQPVERIHVWGYWGYWRHGKPETTTLAPRVVDKNVVHGDYPIPSLRQRQCRSLWQ